MRLFRKKLTQQSLFEGFFPLKSILLYYIILFYFTKETGGIENVTLEFHEDPLKRINEAKLDESAVGNNREGSHNKNNRNGVLYAVDEIPPWHVTILVGFQVFLMLLLLLYKLSSLHQLCNTEYFLFYIEYPTNILSA